MRGCIKSAHGKARRIPMLIESKYCSTKRTATRPGRFASLDTGQESVSTSAFFLYRAAIEPEKRAETRESPTYWKRALRTCFGPGSLALTRARSRHTHTHHTSYTHTHTHDREVNQAEQSDQASQHPRQAEPFQPESLTLSIVPEKKLRLSFSLDPLLSNGRSISPSSLAL